MPRLLLGFALLVLAACDTSVDEQTYPTTLRTLSGDELARATDAYDETNDGRMRTTATWTETVTEHLDDYGLTRVSGTCFLPEGDSPAAISETEAVAIAKDAVVRNARFTNVETSHALRVERAFEFSSGAPVNWQVHFANQTVQGAEVLQTTVAVWLDADGAYCIDGHWYDGVVFAPSPLSPADALAAVVGDSLERRGYRGPGHVVELTEADLPPASEVVKNVFPVVFGDRTELRTVWAFPVLDGEFRLFVDAESGEILDSRQMVIYN